MGDTFYEKLVGRKEKLGKDISKLNAEQLEEYKEFLNLYNSVYQQNKNYL